MAANSHSGLTDEREHRNDLASARHGARARLCAALLGLRRSRRGCRSGGHPVPLDLHDLHVIARLEGHRRDAVRRLGQLRQDAAGRTVPLGDRPHHVVHRATVIAPVLLGVWAAVCFASKFKLRGLARTLFVLPMMATPVAIALVWTMMFHPQLGVLNYLLT